ncbi:MAG: PEP-CTERM sorting domain-containing protein [Pirellulaceae bacterium]
MNEAVVQLTLAGSSVTTANDNSLWAWNANQGLTLIAREGDLFEVAPGDFRTISTWITRNTSDGSGATMGLNDNGSGAMYLLFSDGTRAAVSYNISAVPEPTTVAGIGLGLLVLAIRRRKRQYSDSVIHHFRQQ